MAESGDSVAHGSGGCNLLKGFFGKRGAGGGFDEKSDSASFAADGCDSSEVARLIARARTAGVADERSRAVAELGEFDGGRHPEVLAALIYALNDADAGVRAEAADAIGGLIEEGRCSRSAEVAAALTCALADCDEGVRDAAENALGACGCGREGVPHAGLAAGAVAHAGGLPSRLASGAPEPIEAPSLASLFRESE